MQALQLKLITMQPWPLSQLCRRSCSDAWCEQDLVEALADPKGWITPRKRDQAAHDRSPDGSFAGFEATSPFEYHDVRLPLVCSRHCC